MECWSCEESPICVVKNGCALVWSTVVPPTPFFLQRISHKVLPVCVKKQNSCALCHSSNHVSRIRFCSCVENGWTLCHSSSRVYPRAVAGLVNHLLSLCVTKRVCRRQLCHVLFIKRMHHKTCASFVSRLLSLCIIKRGLHTRSSRFSTVFFAVPVAARIMECGVIFVLCLRVTRGVLLRWQNAVPCSWPSF